MKLIKLLVLIGFCSVATVVSAQKVDQGGIVEALMIKSGLNKQIGLLPEAMMASANHRLANDTKMSAEEKDAFRNAFRESFLPEEILASVKAKITASFSGDELQAIMAWLNSPLGRKITSLEETAYSAQAFKDREDYVKELQIHPPDSDRLMVLEQLDMAGNLTQCSVDMKMTMMMVMSQAMALGMKQDFDKDLLIKQMEDNRQQIEKGSQQEMMFNNLFVYRTLTNQEIEQYIDFYQTPTGQKYMKNVTQSLAAAVTEGSKRVGEKLGKMVQTTEAVVE